MKQAIILGVMSGKPSLKAIHAAIPDSRLLIKSNEFDGYIQWEKGKVKKLRGLVEPDCRDSIVIKYGGRMSILTDAETIVYNCSQAVGKSSNKPLCRKILQDANIAVPKTYFPDSDFTNAVYPLVARKATHSQGRELVMAQDLNHVKQLIRQGFAYFSHVYPKTREFRVHCFMNKIIGIMEKPKPANDTILWNRAQNDAPFEVVDRKDWPMEVCKLALDAFNKIGLDFGAVDIMYKAGSNHPPAVVCETNSSPSISNSPYIFGRYIAAFKWLLASDNKRPKWDYKSFKKPEGLAIKNFQMEPNFNKQNNSKQ
jgi:hypothetical protein